VNEKKKKKEISPIPRRNRGGLVIAPIPRAIEPDHPGRKIIREVREASEQATFMPDAPALIPFSIAAADSAHGREINGQTITPEEEKLLLKSGRPPDEKVDAGVHVVDAAASTSEYVVDAKASTITKSGRPPLQKVDVHKKDRHSKTRTRYTARLETSLFNKIKHFCIDRKLSLQEFFEHAAVHMMDVVDVHQAHMVDVLTPHDDLLMIWKSVDDIITRYRAMTGNRWKPADDRAAARYNQTDIRLVEIGMLYTVLRTKAKKINSFAYFIPEIEEVLAVKLGEETIDALLKHRRNQWDKLKKEKEEKQKG
jgi:hypothetical protein